MNIAGNERLRRQTAGHGDPVDVESFVPIKSQLFSDEMGVINNDEAREGYTQVFDPRTLGAARNAP